MRIKDVITQHEFRDRLTNSPRLCYNYCVTTRKEILQCDVGNLRFTMTSLSYFHAFLKSDVCELAAKQNDSEPTQFVLKLKQQTSPPPPPHYPHKWSICFIQPQIVAVFCFLGLSENTDGNDLR